jgi:penicillin-binding protein-related factor A (putative recombinase)
MRARTNQRGSTAAATLSNSLGQAFQTRLASTLSGYRRAGIADLQKIDPPVRVYGTGIGRRVVFLENPWLDYAGTWTARGGRAIHLEAKATEGERLPIGKAGVSESQLAALRRWTAAGAVAAVIWGHADEMRVVTAQALLAAWDAGAKSIQWRHLPAVHRGTGLIEFDILGEIEARTF